MRSRLRAWIALHWFGRTNRIRCLQAAVSRAGIGVNRAYALRLLQQGWTETRVARIADLAEHAVTVHAFVGRLDARRNISQFEQPMARLLRSVIAAINAGADWATVLAWTAVLASEPDPDREGWLFVGMGWREAEFTADLIAAPPWVPTELAHWSQALGPQAALAWAAGLTQDEAEARAAEGALDESVLRAMAALRGYRLPADARIA